MNIGVSRLFEKDVLLIKDQKLAIRLHTLIEKLEKIKSLAEIPGVKKMEGFTNYYRIRIGNFRLGLKLEEEKILLLRFMHRKDIYTHFP
jgi:mRNA interferase RelE/StbE